MKKNIIIFGGGPHCRCIIDAVESNAQYNIVGIIDSIKDIGSQIASYKIIGRQNELKQITKKHNVHSGIIAVGDNYSRSLIAKEIITQILDFNFVNVIHPSAIISKTAEIGFGNVFLAGAIINVGVKIENHCIVNTGALLEHFSTMKNFASLSPGVVTGGYAEFKEFSAIALGVTVFDRVSIGFNTVIGSGSLVTKDMPDNVLAYGVPAKIIRERKLDEKFLK